MGVNGKELDDILSELVGSPLGAVKEIAPLLD